MKSKISVIVVFFIACFLVGSHALFCNPQNSAENKENKKEAVKILEGMHPFYDSKALDDASKERDKKVVLAILSKYAKAEIKSLGEAKEKFKENPFLGAWLTEFENVLLKQGLAPVGKDVVSEKATTSAATGILSPTMVVDALGRLIAERFKDELAIAYLRKFRDEVKENKLRSLFPSTADFLTSSDIFNFKVFIPTLKDAFQNDLNSLDSNLKKFLIEYGSEFEKNYSVLEKYKLLLKGKNGIEGEIKKLKIDIENLKKELPVRDNVLKPIIEQLKNKENELANLEQIKLEEIQVQEIIAKQKEINTEIEKLKEKELIDTKSEFLAKLGELEKNLRNKNLLNFAIVILDMIQDIKEGKSPIEIINNIDKFDEPNYFGKISYEVSSPISVLALVSRNLMNTEGDGWIEALELKTLIEPNKESQRKSFAGLVYARELDKLNKIMIKGKSLLEIIKNDGQNVFDKIDSYIEKTIKYIEKIRYISNKIKGKSDELKKIKDVGKEIGFEEYYSYLKTGFELIEIGVDIKEITGDANVFNRIKEYLDYGRKLLEISKYIHEKAYGIAFVNALDLLKELLPDESIIKKGILKYGTFMVNLVKAENSTEMKNVLEAAFLPVESYRIKRTSHFNISLNAYPGGFIGGENLTPGEQEIKGHKWGLNLAFTAPVGIAFSWGNDKEENKEKKLGPSRTIFLSAIDIGAVVSFRLSGADSGLPEFKWQNILAPGLYFIVGLRNSPISIGGGIQYGPQLRKIRAKEPASGTNNGENGGEVVNEAVITSSAFRFGLIVAVDIPLFNIHSK